MSAVVQRLLVPVDKRAEALAEARNKMRDAIAAHEGSPTKHDRRAVKLLKAVDTLNAQNPDALAVNDATKCISKRLQRLSKVTAVAFKSDQERDAMIVILFVNCRTRNAGEMRADALALIQLKGSDKAKGDVCQLFPGLRQALT